PDPVAATGETVMTVRPVQFPRTQTRPRGYDSPIQFPSQLPSICEPPTPTELDGLPRSSLSRPRNRQAMRHIFQTILVCPIFISAPAFGADVFSGRDAAHIDWGVKYCGGMSTDKEHAMVEQANARTSEHFMQEYTKESNKLAAVANAP